MDYQQPQLVWACLAGEKLKTGEHVILKQNTFWMMVAFLEDVHGRPDGIALRDAEKDAGVDIALLDTARADYERIP